MPSTKFEIFFPATYTDPDDPTQTPQYVQITEIVEYLRRLTLRYHRYGGYTTSNPFAPPPYSGGYQSGPEERNFWAMLIVPDDFLPQAMRDVRRMVAFFQQKYRQQEILCYSTQVNRYVPMPPA